MEHVQCNVMTYKASDDISARCMVRRTCKDSTTPYSWAPSRQGVRQLQLPADKDMHMCKINLLRPACVCTLVRQTKCLALWNSHVSTKNKVCHQPQLRSFSLASFIVILHGTHSFAVGISRPSWQNLFQPQENAAPSSESTTQCLAPLQTCGRHAAAHELCSPLLICHALQISQTCL